MKPIFILLVILTLGSCKFEHKSANEVRQQNNLVAKSTPLAILKKYANENEIDFSKKYLVVTFIEYYCLPCFKEIPIMNDIVEKNDARSDEFEYLSFFTEKEDLLKAKLKNKEYSFKLLKAASDNLREELCTKYVAEQKLNLEECYLPTTFIIDIKENKIVYRHLKSMENSNDILKLINKLQ